MNERDAAKALKKAVREKALAIRNGIPPEARREKSVAICRRIAQFPWIKAARAVMVYAAVRGEVDLGPLIERLYAQGCLVAFPRVDSGRKSMAPVAVESLGELRAGAFGIPEPPPGAPSLPPEALDAVIVPGVAFDEEGYRLGYGGGYYDRFLPAVREGCVKVGAVYQDLLWPALPREPFDQRVDWVVTESAAFGPFAPPG